LLNVAHLLDSDCDYRGAPGEHLINTQEEWESYLEHCDPPAAEILDWNRAQVVVLDEGFFLSDAVAKRIGYDFKRNTDGSLHLDVFECFYLCADCACAVSTYHALVVLVDEADPARVTTVQTREARYCEVPDDTYVQEFPAVLD
jgi:hypothetical protein